MIGKKWVYMTDVLAKSTNGKHFAHIVQKFGIKYMNALAVHTMLRNVIGIYK
jgi:hypothetical protein